MEVATTSDTYCPSIRENTYVDFVPPVDKRSGIKCPCNGCIRAYTSRQGFRNHITSQNHIRWISNLNANKHNHYKELLEARENVKNQRLIIARLSQQISELSLCLASQVKLPPTESVDLISFD